MCYNEIIMFYITFRVLVLNFLRDYFSEKFYVYNKIEERCRALSYTPLLSQIHNLPVINTTHQNGAFVPIDESSLMYLNHAMSIIYLRCHSRYCAFCDSGQMCNDLIPHCTSAQSIFTALRILSPVYSFRPHCPHPWQTWIF